MSRRESSPADRRAARRERELFDTPSRFMKPRLILYATTFALVGLGLLMIYSSSSIVLMSSEDADYNAAFFLTRQLIFVGVGTVAAYIVSIIDYHIWSRLLVPIWAVTILLLALVIFTAIGAGAYGATRWIAIGGFTLQPSEFAKVTIILVTAVLCERYFDPYAMNPLPTMSFIAMMIVSIGCALVLIIFQPDKGTTIICGVTVIVMLFLSGCPRRIIAIALAIVFVAGLILSFKDEYSRERIMTMLNPWKDPYDASYQLIQGYYAFGSGGLFGVGIGLSRQKYWYLPMAYNDFIFAIIGEELGLVGTLSVLIGFALLVWAGFEIARYASDLSGKLIAAGSVGMMLIQLLVNVCGVLGMIPLSGKPVPFISYGGSSVISCLLLVGFVASVSRHSSLPETEYEERRRDWSLVSSSGGDGLSDSSFSLVGEATPRSSRRDGDRMGKSAGSRPAGSSRGVFSRASGGEGGPKGRVSVDSNGRRRIDLGPTASERLRSARGTAGGRS